MFPSTCCGTSFTMPGFLSYEGRPEERHPSPTSVNNTQPNSFPHTQAGKANREVRSCAATFDEVDRISSGTRMRTPYPLSRRNTISMFPSGETLFL